MSEPMQDSTPENRTHAVVFAEQQERLHRLEDAVRAVCGNERAIVTVRIEAWKVPTWVLGTEYASSLGFHLSGSDLDKLIDDAFALLQPAMQKLLADMGARARLFSEAMGWDDAKRTAEMNTPFIVALCAST